MKTLPEAKLRRLALDKGAALEIDGRPFNASMSTAKLQPVARPAPPPPPSLSMADVERLLAARDEVWRAELARVEAGNRANAWKFTTSYTEDGKVDEINAVRIA